MITFEKCKSHLNQNGIKYTDEEIQTIMDVLYKIAELELQQIEKNK